jgi:hypothetical protein
LKCKASKRNGDPCTNNAKYNGYCIYHIPRYGRTRIHPLLVTDIFSLLEEGPKTAREIVQLLCHKKYCPQVRSLTSFLGSHPFIESYHDPQYKKAPLIYRFVKPVGSEEE